MSVTETKSDRVTKDELSSFCVWTKTGHRPQFFHSTLAGAEAEATRLAALKPGKKFIVMQVVSKFGAPAPEQVAA